MILLLLTYCSEVSSEVSVDGGIISIGIVDRDLIVEMCSGHCDRQNDKSIIGGEN